MTPPDEAQPDPAPGLPVMEVGPWSIEKHQLLRRYVDASREARRKFPIRTLIDLYSGPGRVRNRVDGVESDGGTVVAWREAARSSTAFTRVVVGDMNDEYVEACAARLNALGANVSRRVGPAIDTVNEVIRDLPGRGLHLAYLDPFNLDDLPFAIIARLAALQRIDIVVHFSMMDLHRNMELDFDRDVSRFNAFAPGWQQHVDVPSMSIREARSRFVEYWLQLVRNVGLHGAREQPLITNSKNGPLYRMMFLSRHPLPEKLWNAVARPDQRDLFGD